MKKRGFTLIELLAVIVVLAIIALIATPIVMNIIKSAKKEAAERSVERYLKSIETVFASERLDGSPMDEGTYTISGGKITKDGQEYTVEVTGTVPEKGTVIINRNGTVEVESLIVDGHLCLTKENKIDCNKTENKSASTTDSILTLKDGKETYLTNYKIYGNSFQQTYTGKNLWDGTFIRLIMNANTVGHTGSSNQRGFEFQAKPNTTYSVMVNTTTPSFRLGATDENYVPFVYKLYDGNTFGTITTSSDTTILAVYLGLMTSVDGITLMIVEGEYTADTMPEYEPYVGGVPAPNPEYPQEIVSLGNLVTDKNNANYGKYEIPIRVSGKNLFKPVNGYYQVEQNGVFVASDKWVGSEVIEAKEKEYYIFSWSGDIGAGYWLFYDENMNLLNYWDLTEGRRLTPDGCKYITVYFKPQNATNFQLEQSSQATSYEPYQERTYSIYLDEPLRKVGDVSDYIDFEKGEVVRNFKYKELTENDNWKLNTSVSNHFQVEVGDNYYNKKQNYYIMSNYYEQSNTDAYYCRNKDYALKSVDGHRIRFKNKDYTTLEEWNNWLLSLEEKFYIIYRLATPSNTPITLPKIKLFDGVNHITVGTNIAAGEISVNYYN